MRNPHQDLIKIIHYFDNENIGYYDSIYYANQFAQMSDYYLKKYIELKEHLKSIEWSASEPDYDYDYEENLYHRGTLSICSVCGTSKDYCGEHKHDCWLAKEIYE